MVASIGKIASPSQGVSRALPKSVPSVEVSLTRHTPSSFGPISGQELSLVGESFDFGMVLRA